MATNSARTPSPPPTLPPTWVGIYPAEEPTAMNPPMAIDYNQAPALPGANGVVLTNGKSWCQFTGCGAQIKNGQQDINDHVYKHHDPQSAYQKDLNSGQVQCAWCHTMVDNKNKYVGHARGRHNLRGSSAFIKEVSYEDLCLIRKEWVWYQGQFWGRYRENWKGVLRGVMEVYDLDIELFGKPDADGF
ncbi:hypothetical protein GGR57DRAFT_517643 [Xylariaceae sp. FL1272]|nr:hypothetical protein GGR57DRAFT_517643 [Xylariaceae sp. FL1272]